MSRKYIALVIGLIMLMVLAGCNGPNTDPCLGSLVPCTPTQATATPTATSAPSNTPSATPTGIPAPATNTPTPPGPAGGAPGPTGPTDTPSPTGPAATPTEAAPFAPIADVCKLLDANLVESLVGERMVNTQKTSQPAGLDFCSIRDAQGATGATIGAGQGTHALNYLVKLTAEIEVANGCAKVVDAADTVIGFGAIRRASGEIGQFPLRGNALNKSAYTWGYAKIHEMGCDAQYGVQALTGQGDASFADHMFGDEEISVVSRNTLIYITVVKPRLAAPDLIAAEAKVMQSVLSQLGP